MGRSMNLHETIVGLLRTPEETAAYLEPIFRDAGADGSRIAKALGDIARARGMTQVARDAGLSRESLYKTLSGERSPGFDTVLKVLSALGLELRAEAASASGRQPSGETPGESRFLLRALIRKIPDLVWAKDLEGRYVFCNEKFESLCGVSEQDLLGRTIDDFPDREKARSFRKADLQVIAGKRPVRIEEEVFFADGHREILETIQTPVFRADGRLAFILCVGHDITRRKQLESAHQANLHFLETMDKVQRIFRGGGGMERTLSDLLGAVLSIFGCDRAAIAHPCDPEAAAWTLRMERTGPGSAGSCPPGTTVPMTPSARRMFRALLKTGYPLTLRPDQDFPGNAHPGEAGIRSTLAMAVSPSVGKPWVFSIHQCTHAREWTEAQRVLFLGIGRRLADGLSTLLIQRDLQRSRLEEPLREAPDHET